MSMPNLQSIPLKSVFGAKIPELDHVNGFYGKQSRSQCDVGPIMNVCKCEFQLSFSTIFSSHRIPSHNVELHTTTIANVNGKWTWFDFLASICFLFAARSVTKCVRLGKYYWHAIKYTQILRTLDGIWNAVKDTIAVQVPMWLARKANQR